MWNRSEDSILEGGRYFALFALSASLLMVLMGIVAGAALGQTDTPDQGFDGAIGAQFGEDNVQCVFNATTGDQLNAAAQSQAAAIESQYQEGDSSITQVQEITQVNINAISQECNISVTEVKKILIFLAKKDLISDDGKKFVVDGKKFVVDGDDGKDAAHDQYGKDAAHDQYGADDGDVITTPKEAKEGVLSDTVPKGKKVLPDTGGGGMVVPLPALGVLTLIVGGAASGLLLVRRR
jgi:hypothetical protein